MRARSETAASLTAVLQAARTAYGAGDWATAARLCLQALAEGDHFEALNLLGIIRAQTRHLPEAAALLARAVAARPDNATAHNNYANVLRDLGRSHEAAAEYDRAIALDPHYADAFNNRGGALQAVGQFDAALASYDRAVALRPDYSEAHYNRGVILQSIGRPEEALQSYTRALHLSPRLNEARYNRGIVLHQLRRLHEALQDYDQALQVHASAAVFNNRGNVLQELGRRREALQSYEEALRLDPELADAHNNRGTVLQLLQRPEEALDSFAQALALDPDLPWLFGAWLHTRLQLCDWSHIEVAISELTARILQGRKATQPFIVLAVSDSPAVQRCAAESCAADTALAIGTALPTRQRAAERVIRIGYYSADFRNHAMAQLMLGVFELHDRQRFELSAFHFGREGPDEMTERLRGRFNGFHDVRGRSDREVAQASRELQIDIAVDLMGFTHQSRPGIFAHRAAPLQVSFLGYAGTTGAPYIDYLVADRTVIPHQSRNCYTEKVIYLPNSYFPTSYPFNERQRLAAQREASRAPLGLPETAFVFCCFNSAYKLTPVTFASWMRILSAVPDSVLWLLSANPTVMHNLRLQAQARGVSGTRLIFAPPLPLTDHLTRHRAADLFLDTLPCGAHTTASDALWMGLPVLTLAGESLAARVAASLLTAIGLPELITTTREEYEALAIALATDRERLMALRSRLASNRLTMPLFDTRLLTRHLEMAYREIYRRLHAGLDPEDVQVPAEVAGWVP
jgi:predicted O-linked N-acetylglucosamine transferase (SPINDLY family)